MLTASAVSWTETSDVMMWCLDHLLHLLWLFLWPLVSFDLLVLHLSLILPVAGTAPSTIPIKKKNTKKNKNTKEKKRATGQIYHRVAIFENSNCSFNTSKVTRNSGSSMQQNKYYGEFSKHKPHLPSDFFPVFRTYVCYSYQATWWTLKLQVIAISVRCLYPTVHCFRLHLEFSWVNKVAHYFIK